MYMHFPSQRPLHARARSSSTWRIASPRCALRGQARRFERSFNFTQGRHACGKDQRLAESSNVTQVRQIGDLTGGYLQTTHAQVIGLGRQRCNQAIGTEGLKLDQVGARIRGNVYQLMRELEIAIVIHTSFCDDERLQTGLLGYPGSDQPLRPTCPLPCLTDTKESFRCEIAAC